MLLRVNLDRIYNYLDADSTGSKIKDGMNEKNAQLSTWKEKQHFGCVFFSTSLNFFKPTKKQQTKKNKKRSNIWFRLPQQLPHQLEFHC